MEIRLHHEPGKTLGCVVENTANCAAIVPCFDEAKSIGAVVRAALQQVQKVWVIDDGSSDQTRTEAERAGAAVIRHEVNLGKGAALREGLAAARAAGFQYAVTLDGDGQHDAAEIPKLLEAACVGADLAVGNRMESCAEMSGVRKFVNRWMSAQIERRFGIECPDSQCGFRCVRLEVWAGLQFRQNGFEVESEMLASFARAGLKIAFVPVKCLAAQRPSRIRPIADTVRWFRWWLATK
jgi:glycosyltransferase involved in cell wall biosynthesis